MICKVLAEKLLCKGRVRGEDKEEGRERERQPLSNYLRGASWRGRKPRVNGKKDLCCYFAPNDAQKFDIILIEVEHSS